MRSAVRVRASQACDGVLDDDGRRELAELLSRDASLVEDYAAFVATDALVEIATGVRTLEMPESVTPKGAAPREERASRVKNDIARRGPSPGWSSALRGFRSQWKPLAVAATLLLGVVAWRLTLPFAHFVAVDDARWEGGETYAVGSQLGRGWLTLEQGNARLTFESGAMVSVQGPARFRARSSNGAEIEYGVVSVRTPESASGFRLKTPDYTVVDIGTGFRVSATESGASHLHVTEGRVEVYPGGSPEPLRLSAGQLASAAGPGTPLSVVDRVDPVCSESAEYEAEHPASLAYNAYDHDDRIKVFLESYRRELSGVVRLNCTESGRHDRFDGVAARIEPGEVASTYLVHSAPTRRRHIVEGKITFPGRILGVVCSSDGLNATNESLGAGWSLQCAHPERGLESTPNRNGDYIWISPDRRSLSVVLKTESIDQLRVLVAE